MNVFLSGQKYFGQEALRAIRQMPGVSVVGVSAPYSESKPDRLWSLASAYRLPLIPSENLNAETLPGGVDLIVCAHSHAFVGRKTRLRTTYGAIGYHPSLLPRHRGRDAIRWALRMHDAVTGGSVFWLDNNVDAGPIAAQEWCWIRPGDTAAELWRRDLMPLGLRLLQKVTADVQRGLLVRVPQDEALATWEPAINQPPLRRPDLDMLGDGTPQRDVVITGFQDAARLYGAGAVNGK